jgi:hypothetical protein
MPFGGLSAFPSLDYFSGAKITVRSLPRRDVATGQVTCSGANFSGVDAFAIRAGVGTLLFGAPHPANPRGSGLLSRLRAL